MKVLNAGTSVFVCSHESVGMHSKACEAADAMCHPLRRSIAQGCSEYNITVLIDQKDSVRALRAVHGRFYLATLPLGVGLVGPGLIGGTFLDQIHAQFEVPEKRVHTYPGFLACASGRCRPCCRKARALRGRRFTPPQLPFGQLKALHAKCAGLGRAAAVDGVQGQCPVAAWQLHEPQVKISMQALLRTEKVE